MRGNRAATGETSTVDDRNSDSHGRTDYSVKTYTDYGCCFRLQLKRLICLALEAALLQMVDRSSTNTGFLPSVAPRSKPMGTTAAQPQLTQQHLT
ncbi:hypothetical protein E3N88_00693 [Mikania micrantha]|uniref:Uncharacterized protein n=1 Tax=Mikania micrantha TaxID=192012 RepID=A0A5N6Q086_9ASTR|nr:hypothetical protein E3N88_00693 [Mikania micrantha]